MECVNISHMVYFIRSDIYDKHIILTMVKYPSIGFIGHGFLLDFLTYFYFYPVAPQNRDSFKSLLLSLRRIQLCFHMKIPKVHRILVQVSRPEDKMHDTDLITL